MSKNKKKSIILMGNEYANYGAFIIIFDNKNEVPKAYLFLEVPITFSCCWKPHPVLLITSFDEPNMWMWRDHYSNKGMFEEKYYFKPQFAIE
jgi:hypothetical protein